MDNNKPYNEFDEQFNNLPLPNEEQSWQQMKQMLDEDDRKRRPVIPVFLKSCAGWGLALLIVTAVLWVTIKPLRWWQEKETSSQTETSSKQNPFTSSEEKTGNIEDNQVNPGNNVPGQTNSTTDESFTGTGNKTSTVKNSGTNTIVANGISTSSVDEKLNSQTKNKSQKKGASLLIATKSKKSSGGNKSQIASPSSLKQKSLKHKKSNVNPPLVIAPNKNPEGPATTTQASTNDKTVDRSITKDSLIGKEPIENITPNEKTSLTDTAAVVQKKDKKKAQSKWIFSAGVGLQQQIPVGGQEAVPYDYYGRTGSLSDYIPSVYVRMEKENKWFVQGEFRYGAPQTLKDFQYSKQTKVDTTNMTVTTFRLKKTYYHQLPISFNYYVLPNWTVGVGGIYNRFYGAVTEKEVKQTNLQTQVETLSREIVNIQHFNDSFLYKTQVHALVQTEYHWKRFDFGLRYTKDIQPYIKYTQPDGRIDVKKNQTFQFLVRYQIWQSRKKISG